MFPDLNQRSREILRCVVDAFVATGEPVGSRAVAELMAEGLSPATVRGVMAELEASLQRLKKLPDNTRVICGHGPVTTIGAEKRSNPYL